MATSAAEHEEVAARFEELSLLEDEFEEAELQIIRKTAELNEPLYKKRAEVIAKIPHFWALVFEQAPQEVENFIQPSDTNVFAEALQSIDVSRFELDDPKGSPRSVSFRFGFGENKYFEDKVLEKKFWYRHCLDGWEGLVSEPVKINWKKDQDLTGGLTDGAYSLWQAQQKAAKAASGKPDFTKLPEYKALESKIENDEEPAQSFFAWFGFVSSYKWVGAEESEQAIKKEAEIREKMKRGEQIEDDDDEGDDPSDFQATEVFPGGDELATIIAEDMWPSAIKYYKRAHEADDEDLSELEIEEMDDDESDDEIDIRALVGKGKNKGNSSTGETPPSKKQRKA